MYRVLIVDDEPIIRSGLVHFIDWKQYGCEIAGQAGDGLMAQEQVARLLPDIVITDIKMPGADGMELSRFLSVQHPAVKIIMLTGHADFSYALSAIQYGVVDFLLKPTTNEQVIRAIGKATGLLDKEREADQRLALVREKFFQDMVYGILADRQAILEKSEEYRIGFQSFSLGLIEVHALEGAGNHAAIKSVERVILHAVQAYPACAFAIGSDKIGIAAGAEPAQLAEAFAGLNGSVGSLLGFRMSIGISGSHPRLDGIHPAYKEALAALAAGAENEAVITCFRGEMNDREESSQWQVQSFFERIAALLTDNRLDDALHNIHETFESKRVFKRSLETCKLAGIKLSLLLRDASQQSVSDMHDRIIACETVDEVAAALAAYVKKTAIPTASAKGGAVIGKIYAHIQDRYHEDISLQSIADAVYLNSSYLSKLFHKETGETITEAVTRIRMTKAQELLAHSNIRTNEIAERVGLDNPAYFSYLFKKRFGCTPKHYRESLRQ
ncbi:response regulator [Paenibacillus sp. R14(2021)]|uniref:response regulator transcription factor n=1 Tax=Paenibacillus sp. R14(2021) TaxID=2859228 RepID=UPI001C6118A0|nr:response regulator [Paenibacillus sp. R14(2021)]